MGTPARPRCWLLDLPRRARLEASARAAFSSLRYRRRQGREGPVHVFSVILPVPGYGTRHVTVEFDQKFDHSPRVYADGPSGSAASPHRYPSRNFQRLCMWYPGDPPERRWQPEEGLLVLLGMVSHHLLKEGWWREGGEWLGDEAPHGELTEADDTREPQPT